ncbi:MULTISPECIES: Uma2 family endonuclease [unclassified Streptomyces]|uniref:Uma2 family endonuclease n=1 Tax=unclassified Streptomyces TaxID=2593676 RepID=UPI00201EC46B|nr:Uma2 family endonuclease [Streptomyces sp. 35G-GA-8]MCL7380186.1 Uma2 family endonuclease [Streptomyces sp. 35G-GA-8]
MTAVVETVRIAMAEESNGLTLDKMFELLEEMPVPEGYKVEIVGGAIYMSPQRDTHWEIIRRFLWALEDTFGRSAKLKSDVRFDFPGYLNGFCPDVVKLAADAKQDARSRWDFADVEFIAEVISKDTAANDYGPKKDVYAAAGIPVYVIADPYTGRCHVYTDPKEGEYTGELTATFGMEIDLTIAGSALTLRTDDFPRR